MKTILKMSLTPDFSPVGKSGTTRTVSTVCRALKLLKQLGVAADGKHRAEAAVLIEHFRRTPPAELKKS